ncbi:MAG: HAMP domain-containing sensor histidine kinase, partial [Phycisphaerales bacterium]|nr:HAMP domain-containing sensor histidine kinase [Phycisphaerales bacterium]
MAAAVKETSFHPANEAAIGNGKSRTSSASRSSGSGVSPQGRPPPDQQDWIVPPRSMWTGWRVLGPIAILCAGASLFVGSDVVEHYYFPNMPMGWRHFLLTIRSGLMTVMGCGLVYLVMRHQQRRIEATAEELSRRLEAYRSSSGQRTRFANPNLIHCRDVINCVRTECPMFDSHEQPCWQVMALSKASRSGEVRNAPVVTIQQCHDCEVYRRSCPDGLSQLGESFNGLMFMLDEEAEQVRRMHSQFVEKEKMVAIGQMASGIAHEISNPLSSISSIVQMLKRKPLPQAEVDQLDLMQKHIQRISETVRQLSSLARPVVDRWELVDLASTLEEAVALVSFDRRARNVRIDFRKPSSLPKTYALRAQLQQVFINLLLNALDAMPNGGVLRISIDAHTTRLAFHFDDTGCGIPESIGRRIFEPFFTTKEQGRGTGLGLSVSYGIVQK